MQTFPSDGTTREDGHVKIPLIKDGKTIIGNRVRMEILQSVAADKKRYTTVLLFDHWTTNGKDSYNQGHIITAEIHGSYANKDKEYKVQFGAVNVFDDEDNLIKKNTISTIYEHEGRLFISSERNDQGYEGLQCLTRITAPTPIASFYTVDKFGSNKVCA